MNAGLLADIILGESPYLKGLVRHFNILVLDQNGRITGFNQHFIKHSRVKEQEVMGHSFAQLFDSEEGKAELNRCFRNALKGQPGSITFSLSGARFIFKGVMLPVYNHEDVPSSIIVIAKEEIRTVIEEEEIQDFWILASQMLEEAGVSTSAQMGKELGNMAKPRILLVEDHKGLISKIFKKLIQNPKEEIVLAPTTEAAQLMAGQFKPHVIISHYEPIGNLPLKELAKWAKEQCEASTIYLSVEGNELRIEDGWLDIHVKNQPDSLRKILELIQQLYW